VTELLERGGDGVTVTEAGPPWWTLITVPDVILGVAVLAAFCFIVWCIFSPTPPDDRNE
jgi:hypothetical protein